MSQWIHSATVSRMSCSPVCCNPGYKSPIDAPGDYVELEEGRVYYDLQGPQNGPLVVFIHGMSIPSVMFEEATLPHCRSETHQSA